MARIAVVTMKSQLRGRIRREVTTLLDLDHEVLVIGLRSDGDFLQGLVHPRLRVELVRPQSAQSQVAALVTRAFAALAPSRSGPGSLRK